MAKFYEPEKVLHAAVMLIHGKVTKPGHTGNVTREEVKYAVDWAEKLVAEIEERAEAAFAAAEEAVKAEPPSHPAPEPAGAGGVGEPGDQQQQ